MYEDLPGFTRIYPDLPGFTTDLSPRFTRIYLDLPRIYLDLLGIYRTCVNCIKNWNRIANLKNCNPRTRSSFFYMRELELDWSKNIKLYLDHIGLSSILIDRNMRICPFCTSVEDEVHFVTKCETLGTD